MGCQQVFKVFLIHYIMYDYLFNMSSELGINVWLLSIILIWSFLWKLAAMWKSARRGSWIWFIILALVNTVGILDILYIFVFSELRMRSKDKKKSKKKKKKKSRSQII